MTSLEEEQEDEDELDEDDEQMEELSESLMSSQIGIGVEHRANKDG